MNFKIDFIISNYKWLYHNQIFMDYTDQRSLISSIITELSILPNIDVEADIKTIEKHNYTIYKNLYKMLYKLYSNSTNKKTYLPLLTGLFILDNIS